MRKYGIFAASYLKDIFGMVFMTGTCEKTDIKTKFALDYSGQTGRFIKRMSRGGPANSETFSRFGKVYLTRRRYNQFLRGVELFSCFPNSGYRDKNGRLDLVKMAKETCECSVEECEDPVAFIKNLAKQDQYRNELKKSIPRKNEKIDGFSLPKERKIYFKKGIKEGDKNFAVIHELSHCLLGHEGVFFYKKSKTSFFRKLNEDKRYNEEADKLAAILLMPHRIMMDLLDVLNKELAERFGVTVDAVKKRKKEIVKEIKELCYAPPMLEDQ